MKKSKSFLYIIHVLLFILAFRLFHVQIIKGDFYDDLSKRNYLKFIIIPFPRGLITDRNGNILASNKVKYSLYLVPPYEFDENKTKNLAKILNLSFEELEKNLKKINSYNPAVLLKKNLDNKEISLLESNRKKLPSFIINMELERTYPFGSMASHILGHVGEIGKEEFLNGEDFDYSLGDMIGKSGLEKIYERYLRGRKGYRSIELFSNKRKYNLLPSKDPEPGNTLVLTIDKDLQELAEKVLGDDVGVIIISDPWSGEILALVSHPDFDPNKFVIGFSKKEWEELINNPKDPFNNRAISSLYPPGSIFKLIVALSVLENNKISLREKFYCSGGISLGKNFFGCWKSEGHGSIDFLEGIAQSCNVVFYNLGLRVGPDEISKMAKKFGLDEKTGIDLPGELKGLIPSPAWKQNKLKEPWYPGDTLNMSIGQGYILTTPIEIHFMMSIIATEGLGYKPHLVKKIINSQGEVVKVFEPEILRKVSLKPESWKILKEGMKLVVDKGTGRSAKGEIWSVGGKTGTAQNPHGDSHAWFGAFFPLESPRYVISIFVEHGKSGGGKCAPKAGEIIRYLEKKEVERVGKDSH
ncbi:MAG: penicillin-binding protein 2 [Dictyoglomus sp.]|nr:penicillin-binding protein 2 [Dictyoglomus sp.]MCX7941744.1 penicillin-binding protein 2 [Dictyoglomaceae bacterium]MDW8189037.1 penicillin-binding protein 2 [Dictyoglomus sp.]